MSYTNETTHYHIPKPLGTDLTTPMDYNDSADAIDTAVWGAVQDAAQATSDASDAKTTANGAATDVANLEGTVTTLSGTVGAQGDAITGLTNEVGDVRTDLSDAICAVKEASATAAYAHAVGSFFWYNDTLYKTTQAIAVGATIVPNTNCVTTNVTTEITRGRVSVVADGVKTVGTLLNELAALVDYSRVTQNSTFAIDSGTAKTVYPIERIANGNYRFGRVASIESGSCAVDYVVIDTTSSALYTGTIWADNYARTDSTTVVETAGRTYSVTY